MLDDDSFLDGHVPRLLDQLQDCLVGHFDVEHSTFHFKPAGHADCQHDRHVSACRSVLRRGSPISLRAVQAAAVGLSEIVTNQVIASKSHGPPPLPMRPFEAGILGYGDRIR